jgi:diguanylate cyclase
MIADTPPPDLSHELGPGLPNAASPHRASWRVLFVFLVGALGALASFAVFRLAVSWEVRAAESEFQNRARNYLQIIDGELQASSTLLYTFRAFFEASERPVSRDEFLRFSNDLHGRVVGLRDTGWAPRVQKGQRAAFEREVGASGEPGFRIMERGPAGQLVRAADRDDYYPILYVDTGAVVRPVLGFDLASEPVRRAALHRTVESHRPAATPPIQLLTVKRPRGGVMAFIDVRADNGARSGRKNTDRGIAFGVIDIDAMMRNVIAEKARLAGIDVYIFDPAGTPGDRQVYWRSSHGDAVAAPAEAAVQAGTHLQGEVSLLDQKWSIVFMPGESLEAAAWNWHSIMPLVLGLTMTTMVVAYLVVSLRRTLQLERLTVELHDNAAKISHMARHDMLTDLPNRVLFQERLDDAVAHLRRGTPFSLLCLDLDHFKAANDRLGHGAGDELLRQVSKRLLSCARSVDTVARLGGDEFAVIISGSASADDARRIASRMIDTVGAAYELDGQAVSIGLSVGIALAPVHADGAQTLLSRADRALYAAKAAGRGRFRLAEALPGTEAPGAGAPSAAEPARME